MLDLAQLRELAEKRIWNLAESAAIHTALPALLDALEAAEKREKEGMDILWRDIDDLTDPKLGLVQVASKAANALHWAKSALAAERERVIERNDALDELVTASAEYMSNPHVRHRDHLLESMKRALAPPERKP